MKRDCRNCTCAAGDHAPVIDPYDLWEVILCAFQSWRELQDQGCHESRCQAGSRSNEEPWPFPLSRCDQGCLPFFVAFSCRPQGRQACPGKEAAPTQQEPFGCQRSPQSRAESLARQLMSCVVVRPSSEDESRGTRATTEQTSSSEGSNPLAGRFTPPVIRSWIKYYDEVWRHLLVAPTPDRRAEEASQ